jgi:hypothetical protein
MVVSFDCVRKSSDLTFNPLCDASFGHYATEYCFFLFYSLPPPVKLSNFLKLTSFILIALTQIQPTLTWETEGKPQYTEPTWEPC